MFTALGTLMQHVAHGLLVFTTLSYINVRLVTISQKNATYVNKYQCLFTIFTNYNLT